MALSKIGSNQLKTLSSKLTLTAADGSADNDWVMEVRNDEQTDDRSFGLKVSAGSTATDRALDVRDHSSASNFLNVNGTGFVTRPQAPMCSVTKNVNTQTQTISGTNYYTLTGMTSAYLNSHSTNNKSYFNTNNSRFEIPSGQASGYYFCSFTTLIGIERPNSGTNWGWIGIRKNSSAGLSNHINIQAYREVVNASSVASKVWETLNCAGVHYLDADEWVEPIFTGSAGISISIHSGNYTHFSVVQIA